MDFARVPIQPSGSMGFGASAWWTMWRIGGRPGLRAERLAVLSACQGVNNHSNSVIPSVRVRLIACLLTCRFRMAMRRH